jgi:putative nucleotidyltransferase with HDIG domain
MSKKGRIYIAAVLTAGIATLVHSGFSLLMTPPEPHWLVLAILTILAGSFSIKLPSITARFSVSDAFVFASVLSFGGNVASVIVALDTLILTNWRHSSDRAPLRVLFNMSAGTLAIWSSSQFFAILLPDVQASGVPLNQLVGPVLGLAVSYFAFNSGLIALAVGFEQRSSPFVIWRDNFAWLILNYIGGASVALLLVTYASALDLSILGAIVPLLIIIYLTFRTSLDRVEDANSHVAHLNELYMATIESLAMAVDAKDQITHGHIRRVQVYAVHLAKRIGILDEQQLKAIEAAALLHDMGKLAIPEHILNKPGSLTPAEFDKMKRHSDIGADLLSSVRFPYPVVPIVRHHHENWDGSGYPSGISGSDIPIGARVLSVVDCFDALTSDRPYRPRLATAEAFEILRNRRGTMYDPLIVDTFIDAHPDIAPAANKAGMEARRLAGGIEVDTPEKVSPFQEIRATAFESALLATCEHNISAASNQPAVLASAALCLRQLTPATVLAFYRYDAPSDSLRCERAVGDSQGLLQDLNFSVGERVTGWTAATRRTSVNSDATLDIAQIASVFKPPLRSTISTPIVADDVLIGVLTAYSPKDTAFSESHKYSFEHVAALLANSQLFETSRRIVPFSGKRNQT